jgi:hypothetical protein
MDTQGADAVVESVERLTDGRVDRERVALLVERIRNFSHLAASEAFDYRERVLWERRAAHARRQFERETGLDLGAVYEGQTGDPQARWPFTCRARR